MDDRYHLWCIEWFKNWNVFIFCKNLIRNADLFYITAKASKPGAYNKCDNYPDKLFGKESMQLPK